MCLDKLVRARDLMWPKTCPYFTLTTIVATGHYNTMCRQLAACSGVLAAHQGHHELWKVESGAVAPNPLDKTVTNNICGEVKLALKDMAKAPNPGAHFGAHNLQFIMLP